MKPGRIILSVIFAGLTVGSGWMLFTSRQTSNHREELAITIPGSVETGKISIEWPDEMRVGESAIVRIEARLVDSCLISGCKWLTAGQTGLEVRMELPGMHTQPFGLIRTALTVGSPVIMEWQVVAMEAGSHRGTAWIFLNQYAKNGILSQDALLAAPLITLVGEEAFLPPVFRQAAIWAALLAGLGGEVWVLFRLSNVTASWHKQQEIVIK